jgi:DNA-binding NarL/FixJ family response regulator
MRNKPARTTCIRVAVVESDPLRFAGFKAVLESESDLQLRATSLTEIVAADGIDVVLVASRSGQNVFRDIEMLKAVRPDFRIMVTGSGISDGNILDTLACGGKGYVDEAAPVTDFVRAIRLVAQGMIWAPRRVLATFIDRSINGLDRGPVGGRKLTSRENEVLELLVEGRPNKDIGLTLGIEERTVKAHVARLLRKAGVRNRIMLSVHAINHGLVAAR